MDTAVDTTGGKKLADDTISLVAVECEDITEDTATTVNFFSDKG